MKMSGLCWVAVVLAFSLSIGNSWAVKLEDLTKIVKSIKNKLNYKGQFSLAVNIPENQNLNQLEQVFEKDDSKTVKETISKDEVYKGTNVVAAKFKTFTEQKCTDHAEARVLDNMKALADSSEGKTLVFYSYLSPCGTKCTNTDSRYNILNKINKVFPKWKDYAFVFSRVFDKTRDGTLINQTERVEALKQLGESKIGHNNIYRCYKPKNSEFNCIRCRREGELLDECVNNWT